MLDFCESFSAGGGAFSHKDLVQICGVNSGLGGEFLKVDLLAAMSC
jgi:hypothetical protein